MTQPDPRRSLSDDELIRLVGDVLDEDEPLPRGAIQFAAGTLVWRSMEGELAELLHDSDLEEAIVLRDEVSVRLLVFQAGDVTLDVEHGPAGLAGAVSPPGLYRVELQEAGMEGPGSPLPAALTDESGMFTLPDVTACSLRLVVRDAQGRVAILSPWITL